MLPNPFEKSLPRFEDTDPLKNAEIVREFLGPERAKKFALLFSGTKNEVQQPTSTEELLAMSAVANKLAEEERRKLRFDPEWQQKELERRIKDVNTDQEFIVANVWATDFPVPEQLIPGPYREIYLLEGAPLSEFLAEQDRKGLRPVGLYELLEYLRGDKNNWWSAIPLVALDSRLMRPLYPGVWRDPGGTADALYLETVPASGAKESLRVLFAPK